MAVHMAPWMVWDRLGVVFALLIVVGAVAFLTTFLRAHGRLVPNGQWPRTLLASLVIGLAGGALFWRARTVSRGHERAGASCRDRGIAPIAASVDLEDQNGRLSRWRSTANDQ
jgi:di/tricarboxylate transporter